MAGAGHRGRWSTASPGASRPHYRGHDRRAHLPATTPFGRPFLLASLTLATVTVAVVTIGLRDPAPRSFDVRDADALLWATCSVLALVAGCVSCLRWRMVGDASSLRVGVAMVVLAVLVVVIDLVPFVDRAVQVGTVLARFDAATSIVLIALLGVAVVAPPIDAASSSGRMIAITSAAIVALVVLQFVVPLGAFRHGGGQPQHGSELTAAVLTVVVLLPLAAISIARGVKAGSWLWAWLGLGLVAFGAARTVGTAADVRHDVWTTGALVLGVCGLLCVMNGVAQELKRAFFEQREQLFDQQIDAEVTEARQRAERHEREERAHEARSAVLAIQSAVSALAHSYDDVGGRDRSSLRDAILAEIDLLRYLVAGEPARSSCAFDVADSVLPVVVCQRASGLDIDAHVPRGLRAVGNPAELTEVVQGLLDNARDHAPGSLVTVRASRRGREIVLRVADHGPGVPEHQRERVFARGASTRPADGGLGLYVARRLLCARGGDLQVETAAGGGASFVVTLPAASYVAVRPMGEHPSDEVDDVPRAVDAHTLEFLARDQ